MNMTNGKLPTCEFNKPGMNPFFAAMASSQTQKKAETPVQKLYAGLRGLEKLAEAGDIRGWQEGLPAVEKLASEVLASDSMKLLETQVQIKKYELTLFLKASKGALQQAQATERQAKEAELADQDNSRELWAKAQKLKSLGQQFQERLSAKLSLF